MSLDAFWEAIDTQIDLLTRAKTADDVLRICPSIPGVSSGDGFFGGSGGDHSVLSSLEEAGWHTVWFRAHYHWCAEAPNGDRITYTEGDLDRGNGMSR